MYRIQVACFIYLALGHCCDDRFPIIIFTASRPHYELTWRHNASSPSVVMGNCDRLLQDRVFHRRPCHGQLEGLRPLPPPLRAATLPRVTRAARAAGQPRPPCGRYLNTKLNGEPSALSPRCQRQWWSAARAAVPTGCQQHAPPSRHSKAMLK